MIIIIHTWYNPPVSHQTTWRPDPVISLRITISNIIAILNIGNIMATDIDCM